MKLALALPWSAAEPTTRISNPGANTSLFTDPNIIDPVTGQPAVTLGAVITRFGEIAIFAGGFLMFFWAAWGVFDYIRAEGNKDALAKARKRIQWAIAGFVILVLSFFLSNFVRSVLNPGVPPLTEIKLR